MYDVSGPYFSIIRALAREGLVPDEEWVGEHCDIATRIFKKELHLTAMVWAASHKYALDYIRQAPVLVVMAQKGKSYPGDYNCRYIARQVYQWAANKADLKYILGKYKLSQPMRRLAAINITCELYETIKLLGKINPSTLGQSIPYDYDKQYVWLRRMHECHVWNFSSTTYEWLAKNIPCNHHLGDVIDYIRNHEATFNTKWTWGQAARASERWHREIYERSEEEQFFAKFGLGWKDKIPYKGLPERIGIKQFEFVALQSGEDLYIEGKAMRHCVGTYSGAVIKGLSRIYSIGSGDRRIATIELRKTEGRVGYEWRVNQLKGPCNIKPPVIVWNAATEFMKRINEWKSKS